MIPSEWYIILEKYDPWTATIIHFPKLYICHLIRETTYILLIWRDRQTGLPPCLKRRNALFSYRYSCKPFGGLYVYTHRRVWKGAVPPRIISGPIKEHSRVFSQGTPRAEETHPEYRARRDSHPRWRGIHINRQWIPKRASSSTCVGVRERKIAETSRVRRTSAGKLRRSLSDQIALKSGKIGEIPRDRNSRLFRERINYSKLYVS